MARRGWLRYSIFDISPHGTKYPYSSVTDATNGTNIPISLSRTHRTVLFFCHGLTQRYKYPCFSVADSPDGGNIFVSWHAKNATDVYDFLRPTPSGRECAKGAHLHAAGEPRNQKLNAEKRTEAAHPVHFCTLKWRWNFCSDRGPVQETGTTK